MRKLPFQYCCCVCIETETVFERERETELSKKSQGTLVRPLHPLLSYEIVGKVSCIVPLSRDLWVPLYSSEGARLQKGSFFSPARGSYGKIMRVVGRLRARRGFTILVVRVPPNRWRHLSSQCDSKAITVSRLCYPRLCNSKLQSILIYYTLNPSMIALDILHTFTFFNCISSYY